MFLEQFTYEIRHLSGSKNEISDGLSRLHMRNLMATAPTNAEAELERTTGVITPSTHLQGVKVADQPFISDDPDDIDCDGEGGQDEALFQAITGMSDYTGGSLPCKTVPEELMADGWWDIEPTEVASAKAAEAKWEELEDDEGTPAGTTDLERKLQATYGKGFNLLRKAGCIQAEILSREPKSIEGARGIKDRRGLGAGEERHHWARLNVELGEEVEEVVRSKIRQVHNDRVGHLGKLRTYRRLRKLPGFPWNQPTEALHRGVVEWCEGCLTCQKIWSLRGRPGRPGGAIIRQRPFTEISIDLVVLTHEDRDGNKYILNVMDSFSRFSELFPLRVGDAESVAEALFAVYNRYGRPRVLRADGAKAFHGSVLKSLNRMLGVENHATLAYSPYQNGQNERQNQEIGRHLRALVLGDVLGTNSRNRWGVLCSAAQRILNNTVHGDLMATPNELMLGGYGDSDMAMFQDDPAVGEGEEVMASEYARELEEAQFRLLTRSEKHQEQILSKVMEQAEREGRRQIEEGQYVLALRGGLGGRPKEKLQCRYTGPYLVTQRPDPAHSIVECMHIATRELVNFHMDTLQVCNMSHFSDVAAAIPYAERDDWTYTVERIISHRPTGPRGRRAKSRYEFEVLYRNIPRSSEPGDENPSFQPWSNVKHLSALKDYCRQPAVAAELGAGFYVSENEDGE
jgi:hypothetical protein